MVTQELNSCMKYMYTYEITYVITNFEDMASGKQGNKMDIVLKITHICMYVH